MKTDLMEKENDFEVIQSYECLNACLTNFLHLTGRKDKPSTVFFGGEGFRFKYREEDDQNVLLSDMYKANFIYMDRISLQYFHAFYNNPSEALFFVGKGVKEGRCFALKIQSDSLKYNRVYAQTIALHYINIVDYCEEKQEFFILDGDVPTAIPSCFCGWVDAKSIIDGWLKTNCEYVEFVNSEDLSTLSKDEMKKNIKLQLMEYYNAPNEDKGVSAVRKYFDEISRCEESQLSKLARDVNYQIKIEGIWASRHFLLEYLSLNDFEEEMIEELKVIIKQWNNVCMMCIKLSISKREKELIVSMLVALLEREKDLFDKVIENL